MSLARLARSYERSYRRAPSLTLAAVNGILAVVGDGAAQILPMLVASSPDGFNLARTFRYWVFGTIMGPVGGKWNEFLEHKFPLHPRPAFASSPHVDEKTAAASTRSHVIGMTPTLGGGGQAKTNPKGAGSRPLTGRVAEKMESGEKVKDEGPPSRIAVLKRLACDQLIMAPISILLFLSFMCFMEGVGPAVFQSRVSTHYLSILKVNWQIWPIVQLFNFRYLPLKYRVPFTASCGILWTVFLSFSTRPPTSSPLSSPQDPTMSIGIPPPEKVRWVAAAVGKDA